MDAESRDKKCLAKNVVPLRERKERKYEDETEMGFELVSRLGRCDGENGKEIVSIETKKKGVCNTLAKDVSIDDRDILVG